LDDEDLEDDEEEIDDEIDAAPQKAVKTNQPQGGFFGSKVPQQQQKPQNQNKPQN